MLKLYLDSCHRSVWRKFDIPAYSFITKPSLHKNADGTFQVPYEPLGAGIATSYGQDDRRF
jgi:hypothetical protein